MSAWSRCPLCFYFDLCNRSHDRDQIRWKHQRCVSVEQITDEESLTIGHALVAAKEEEDSRHQLRSQGQEDAAGVEEDVAADLHGSDGSDPLHRV